QLGRCGGPPQAAAPAPARFPLPTGPAMIIDDLTRLDSTRIFVNGAWVAPSGGEALPVEDPSTGRIIGRIGRGGPADVGDAVQAAAAALEGGWGRLTATERGRILMRMSALVTARAEDLAMIETLDVGKPLSQ